MAPPYGGTGRPKALQVGRAPKARTRVGPEAGERRMLHQRMEDLRRSIIAEPPRAVEVTTQPSSVENTTWSCGPGGGPGAARSSSGRTMPRWSSGPCRRRPQRSTSPGGRSRDPPAGHGRPDLSGRGKRGSGRLTAKRPARAFHLRLRPRRTSRLRAVRAWRRLSQESGAALGRAMTRPDSPTSPARRPASDPSTIDPESRGSASVRGAGGEDAPGSTACSQRRRALRT